MAFSKETFGTLENGAVITKYTLTNKHGIKASFTDLGGIWLEMWVPDKHGTLADVVLGYDEPENICTRTLILARSSEEMRTASAMPPARSTVLPMRL